MRAVLVALLTLPALARAADPVGDATGVLSVADPPGPGIELVDLTRSLRAAFAEQVRGVLSPEELRQLMSGSPSTATLTELDRAYGGATAASQSGDYEGAVRTLRAVVEDLERLPASPEAFAQWSRAMLRLARTEGNLGRKGESRELLERLLRADPGVKVDLEQYPPSFAKQVDEVRAALRSAPQRKLVVTSARPARVFVEGREVGSTPLTLTLPAGSYRVSAMSNAVRLPSVHADLGSSDQTVALDFGVADMYRPDAGPGLALAPAQRASGIITAGASLRLDRVVAASVISDGDVRYLVGSLYDVRKGSLLREGRMRLSGWKAPDGGLQAMVTFLLKGEASGLVIAGGKPGKAKLDPKLDLQTSAPVVVQPSEPGEGGRRRPGAAKKWTAAGTGVLAVGLGAYALYEANQSSDKYSSARKMLNPDGTPKTGVYDEGRYNALRDDAKSARTRATVAGVGAGVALGVSAVIGYLGYKESGTFGKFTF